MGSRTDIGELLSQCLWSDEGSYLGELAKSTGFPLIAKVSRGQYSCLGQPSFSNPSLISHVLLVSAGKVNSIVAQCVKFKNARQRVLPYGPTLVIPEEFPGHFEILNEDGKAVPSLETVEGLAKRFPDAALVREPFKACKAEGVTPAPLPLKILGGNDEGYGGKLALNPSYRISEKSRVLQTGEIVVLVGEVSVPLKGGKISKFLRCFDQNGHTLFLPQVNKGKFSPLAKADSISGVHTTQNILSKRMPLMVRIVDGKPPLMASGGKNSNFKFAPELRLYSTLNEELIFAMPLSQKEVSNVVPMPSSVPLKLQMCRNMPDVEGSKEFSRIHDKVLALVKHAKAFIQIYDINLKKELRFDGRQWKSYAPPIFFNAPPSPSCSTDEATEDRKLSSPTSSPSSPDPADYEDIDEIYDYVRGIKPMKSTAITENAPRQSPTPPRRKSSTTLVTITSAGPDVIAHVNNNSLPNSDKIINQDKPVISHRRHSCQISPISNKGNNYNYGSRIQKSKSVDKLLDLEEEDYKPEPPPIETIPSLQNKYGGHFEKSDIKIHQEIHQSREGTQIQIQIRNVKEENNRNQLHHIRREDTPLKKLDSTGGSLSTTPTNTSGSGSSNQSKSSKGSSGVPQPPMRTHLYIKRKETGLGQSVSKVVAENSINLNPLASGGEGLSGSPKNRLLFRRSPIFDFRYKSMNDLNCEKAAQNQKSNAEAQLPQRLIYFNGGMKQQLSNSTTNLNFPPTCEHSSQKNLNVVGLNLNSKKSSALGKIFRPKSLTNIALDDGLSKPLIFGGGSSGVKKRLQELVMPSHAHHHHGHVMSSNVPIVPPRKVQSHRNPRQLRKGSVHNNSGLFL